MPKFGAGWLRRGELIKQYASDATVYFRFGVAGSSLVAKQDLDSMRLLHGADHRSGVSLGRAKQEFKPCLHPLLAVLRQHGVRADSRFYLPELLALSESLRLRCGVVARLN